MNNVVNAYIINFEKKELRDKNTGEVKIMFSVNFAVQTDNIKNFYGSAILNSYVSENAFEKLKSSLGKTCKLTLEERSIFGKSNTYKKVVSKIDGLSVRDF